MSIWWVKDRADLVCESWLPLEWYQPHRIRLYLWKTSEALSANAPGADGTSAVVSGRDGHVLGSFNAVSWTVSRRLAQVSVTRTIAELHFVQGRADAEIIAHEVAHLQQHIVRVLAGISPWTDMFDEEKLCYTIGRISSRLSKWLRLNEAFRDP
jgi:hypothetical protein